MRIITMLLTLLLLASTVQAQSDISTNVYTLAREDISGVMQYVSAPYYTGAIDALGNNLLVVGPALDDGGIVLIGPNGNVESLVGKVPTNLEALQPLLVEENGPWLQHFRVTDILLNEAVSGRFNLYVSHHYLDGECIRFRVSQTVIEGKSVNPAWKKIFDLGVCLPVGWLPLHQTGGKMLMDGPGHLLVTIGDYSRRDFPPLGEVLRVNIATGESETFTRGHRNQQGLVRDAEGNLWATEHGPRGGDELNLLIPGRDYGWPNVSYGLPYDENASLNSDAGVHSGDYTLPVYVWVPSIGPTSIVQNNGGGGGGQFPLWRDDLLIASLVGRSIFRIRLVGGLVQFVEEIAFGSGIRDMAWMPDGRLALLHGGSSEHPVGVLFLKRSGG